MFAHISNICQRWAKLFALNIQEHQGIAPHTLPWVSPHHRWHRTLFWSLSLQNTRPSRPHIKVSARVPLLPRQHLALFDGHQLGHRPLLAEQFQRRVWPSTHVSECHKFSKTRTNRAAVNSKQPPDEASEAEVRTLLLIPLYTLHIHCHNIVGTCNCRHPHHR